MDQGQLQTVLQLFPPSGISCSIQSSLQTTNTINTQRTQLSNMNGNTRWLSANSFLAWASKNWF